LEGGWAHKKKREGAKGTVARGQSVGAIRGQKRS